MQNFENSDGHWIGKFFPPINLPWTYTLLIFRSSPQNKKRSRHTSNRSFLSRKPTTSEGPVRTLQTKGFPASSRTLTSKASKLLPTLKSPIWLSSPHTLAPPAVARYSKVAMGKGLLAKPVVVGVVDDLTALSWIEITLAAMLAFWIALRMEMLNPPETSVPRPT